MAEVKGFRGPVGRAITWVVTLLARFGIVDQKRGEDTANLALPRVLTGLARNSQRTADFVMVGIAVGPAGIAGLALAAPFWSVASGIGSGITNGSIGLISQRFGAKRYDEMDVVIKQTMWVCVFAGGVLTVVYYLHAETLIGLIGGGTDAVTYGAIYLETISLAIVIAFVNKIGIRTLVGTGDSWIEMVIRVAGAVVNVTLNAVFIFHFGLGVYGAALGTVLARSFVLCAFSVGFYVGRLPLIGEFPARLGAYPHVNPRIIGQLVTISAPLIMRRSARRAALFPLLAIVATFGTTVVAAYGVAREVYELIQAPNWGFSLAASSLVGQELGANDEREAERYGWDVTRFAIVVYVVLALPIIVLAEPIARVFTDDPAVIRQTVPFVQILSITAIPAGIDSVTSGVLTAGGDTTWPMYGRLAGLYVFSVPIAYLAIVTPLGIVALYVSMLTESLVPALVTLYRVNSEKWKEVSRQYRPAVE